MTKNLNSLTKLELLEIIGKMKKEDLIKIINNKIGGTEELIKQTTTSSRKAIIFDKSKLLKKNNLAMANDNLYLENNN